MALTQAVPADPAQATEPATPATSKVPLGTDVVDDSLDMLSALYEYNHWIYSLIRPHVAGRILEIGCGVGNITRFLAISGREVVGIDPVDHFVERFKERLGHMSHVTSSVGYLQDLAPPDTEAHAFDTVVSCNVLEHIQDDVDAVSAMARQVRPGGKVVLFVPAGPVAFGRLDRELGHYRRYTIRSLKKVFHRAGLQWVAGRYSNSVGLFGWWFNSVVLGRCHVPSQQAAVFNRCVPLISALERLAPVPFGQSVLGVGLKKDTGVMEPPGSTRRLALAR